MTHRGKKHPTSNTQHPTSNSSGHTRWPSPLVVGHSMLALGCFGTAADWTRISLHFSTFGKFPTQEGHLALGIQQLISSRSDRAPSGSLDVGCWMLDFGCFLRNHHPA